MKGQGGMTLEHAELKTEILEFTPDRYETLSAAEQEIVKRFVELMDCELSHVRRIDLVKIVK